MTKNRSICKNLEQIMEELPIFLMRAEEFSSDFDEVLQQNESQFHFKVCASKVSEVIKNLSSHKECIQDSLLELCDLIQRDIFFHCLISLNLLDSTPNTTTSEINEKYSTKTNLKTSTLNCNWTDSICISPPAHRSRLSKAAGELLKTKKETDMIFEIIASKEFDSTDELVVETSAGINMQPEVYRIEAHRVIVASRCDWFRRALLSGMQEDIHRKIVIHNTSPYLFSLFLEFLYSGTLDYSSLSDDQMFELLFLGDKYELDSLKKFARNACEQFIAQNPEVMDSDLFEELPQSLQSEIYDAVICEKPLNIDLILGQKLSATYYNVSDIEEMAANVHLNSNGNIASAESDDIAIFPEF